MRQAGKTLKKTQGVLDDISCRTGDSVRRFVSFSCLVVMDQRCGSTSLAHEQHCKIKISHDTTRLFATYICVIYIYTHIFCVNIFTDSYIAWCFHQAKEQTSFSWICAVFEGKMS